MGKKWKNAKLVLGREEELESIGGGFRNEMQGE